MLIRYLVLMPQIVMRISHTIQVLMLPLCIVQYLKREYHVGETLYTVMFLAAPCISGCNVTHHTRKQSGF